MQAVWSVKGGVGASVVAAALALVAGSEAVLVDLAGDQPALFGLDLAADVPGVAAWTRAGDEVPPDALSRLELTVAPGVVLVPRGTGPCSPARLAVLGALLRADPRPVVVDLGTLAPGDPRLVLADGAHRSLLVTRACPVAQARLAHLPARPTGVVVVRDHGRAVRWPEVAEAVGAPVLAEIDVDPAVGAAVDGGLAVRPLPRSFLLALRAAS